MTSKREIRFRGLSINGEWYYGLLSKSVGLDLQPPEGYYISNSVGQPWAYHIRSETIGQFTGLKDMNGSAIWEDDIVKYYSSLEDKTLIVTVNQVNGLASFFFNNTTIFSVLTLNKNIKIEVIGNVFDNPELLEKKK